MPPKLLFVENDLRQLEYGAIPLEEECGFRVLKAPTGDQAIALLKAERPQVMLLNLELDISGFTVLREAMALQPELIVYVLTGFQEARFRDRALQMGAREYWIKPMDMGMMVEKFKELARELEAKGAG